MAFASAAFAAFAAFYAFRQIAPSRSPLRHVVTVAIFATFMARLTATRIDFRTSNVTDDKDDYECEASL